jgi:hypothetical protein
MRSLKTALGLAAALIPVVYCGGLFLYFNDVRDSAGGLLDDGLGPTILGLGALGLLFTLPVVLKILRLLGSPASPAIPTGGSAGEEASDFDPDAALARYMARRNAPDPASSPPQTRPGGFGRKGA